jgi:hypothetical protein
MNKKEYQTGKIDNVYQPDKSIESANNKPNKFNLSKKAITTILLLSLACGGLIGLNKLTNDDDKPKPKPYTVDTAGGTIDTLNEHIQFSGEQTVVVKDGEGMNNLIYDVEFNHPVGSQNYDAIDEYIKETNTNIVDKKTDQINLQSGTKVHLPTTGQVEYKKVK